MTDKQIIFKCDVDCIRKNTEECFELDCIKGQESILKQLQAKEQECEELKDRIDNIRDFAKQGRDMFVEQGSFADWYKVAECMKNDFNFILYEIDDEE